MNLTISISDDLAKFVKTTVETGRYTSSGEVVNEALRLLEKHEHEEAEKRLWLQNAWKEGLESGDFAPLDMEAIKSEGRKRLSDKV